MQLKLLKVVSPVGAIFTKKALARIHEVAGRDPDFAEHMCAAKNVMKKRRAVLRDLA